MLGMTQLQPSVSCTPNRSQLFYVLEKLEIARAKAPVRTCRAFGFSLDDSGEQFRPVMVSNRKASPVVDSSQGGDSPTTEHCQ